MSTQTDTATTTVLVNRIWIKADTATVWKAITSPEWNARYGYKSPSTFELTPGGSFSTRPSADMVASGVPADQVILDGEVLEVVEGSRLVLTWRTLWDDEARARGSRG